MSVLNLGNRIRKNIVFRNAFYLSVIQIASYIFPILTIPFLIRKLGVSSFGVVAYSQLIVTYLCVLCDYGFNMSATRKVSINKTDKDELNKIFSSVIYCELIIGIITVSIACIGIACLPMFQGFRYVYFLALPYVFGQIFFPTWFFQGLEQLVEVTIFIFIFRFLFTSFTFLLIKSPDDIFLVSIIYSMGSLVSGLSAFFFCVWRHKLHFQRVSLAHLKGMFFEGFDIFLPSFFSNFLSSGGVFVLGLFYSTSVIGYYSGIERIVKAGIALLDTITQSLFPNISYKFSVDKKSAIRSIFKIGSLVIGLIILALLISLFAAKYFLGLVYNPSYLKYSYVLNILLIWAILLFLNNFIGVQFLVGSGNSKFYRKSAVISGIIMVLSFITIKFWSINGVLFSSILGEGIRMIIMIFFIKRYKLTD
jgi:PST family polysaccharide transporter